MFVADTLKFPAEGHSQTRSGTDRLPLAVAGPVVLVLSVLCWGVVWEVARLLF